MKRFAFLLVAISVLLTGCVMMPPISPEIPDSKFALTNDVFDAELVDIRVKGDYIKVDSIQPGLDTYSFTTAIYDLKSGEKLGVRTFSEDAWETGLYNDGFYAISLQSATVWLYGFDGNERQKVTVSPQQGWAFAAVDASGEHLLYGDLNGGMHFYSLASDTHTVAGKFSEWMNVMETDDACFYLHSPQEELLKVVVGEEYPTVVYADDSLSIFTPRRGVSSKDTSFFTVSADNRPLYIEKQTVDEWVIAAGENEFVSRVCINEGDLLRFYDLQTKKIREYLFKDIVCQVICRDGDQADVVLVKDSEGCFRVHFANTPRAELRFDTTDSATSNNAEPFTPSAGAVIIDGVPAIAQMPTYPTGCESLSAVMALQYAGENITVDRFIDEFLPKSTDFYYADGKCYGPDPFQVFIGDPRSSASYGCMAPVIEKAINAYFGGEGRVENTTGKSLVELCSTYIDRQIPVIVWASIDMVATHPGNVWYLPDGTKYVWTANEHCLLLVGYDELYYYFNDPYNGACVKYKKHLCEKPFIELGCQSLVIV